MIDLRNLPADFYADPYPQYQQLQSNYPVALMPDGGYFITRYSDVREIYRAPALFSSDKCLQFAPVFGEKSALYEHHTTSLVFNDPPLHTQVRRAIGNALSPRLVQSMRIQLVNLVDDLLDQLEDQSKSSHQVDLIANYASAIPVEIIGNLLGIPKSEREPLRAWSLAILGSLEVDLTTQQKSHGERSVEDFVLYLRELIARQRPDAQSDNILHRLINWRSNEGQPLSAIELHHQCIFLLNAGHETTTNLIGNAIELLLRFPDELKKLLADPALITSAVEEVLRFESSNQLGNRTTTQTTKLNGIHIPNNSVLTLCIGAANRDPEIFEKADSFNIERNPNPHLAFGAGIHTCAGLNVARLEGQIAIQKFFQRFPYASLQERPKRALRARFRGFETLPVNLNIA